jgi:hypothetical protein
MVDFRNESGSSLIWFIGLIVVIVMVCLTLAVGVHQYLFARELKDFVEEYALAAKGLLIQGRDFPSTQNYLNENVLSLVALKDLEIRDISIVDSKTVQVIACAKWESPLSFLSNVREICESSLAR